MGGSEPTESRNIVCMSNSPIFPLQNTLLSRKNEYEKNSLTVGKQEERGARCVRDVILYLENSAIIDMCGSVADRI